MTLPKECLLFFAKLIEDEIGIVYSEVNHYQLISRLEEIARQLGHTDALTFWNSTHGGQRLDGVAKMLLLDTATNNETFFFRDTNVFKAIENIFLNAGPTSPDKPFRIWSAACSTGQEMLSLAILKDEISPKRTLHIKILGTDISDRALRRAEKATYSQLEVQRGLSAPQLIRYFEPAKMATNEPPQWSAKSSIRENMTFKKLNLLQTWHGLDVYDLILCRNVLIYQTVENKRKVVNKLEQHLSPGGILILGGAESLVGISETLVWEDCCGASIYRKPINRSQKVS